MRSKFWFRTTAVFIISFLVLSIFVEEIYFARLLNLYRNFYSGLMYRPIYVKRDEKQFYHADSDTNAVDIAIVTVLKNRDNYEEYRAAQNLFECYAIYHKYHWILIDISENATLQKLCPHKDFMFQRHCVLAEVMPNLGSNWILFIDADMAVINPNHLIEEWIDNDYNMIFYLRIFNFEIMAGSYLAKNTAFSRKFLHLWADYEYKVPNSFHGTDNGAIHSAVLETVFPEKKREKEQCEKLWRQSRSYSDLSIYEACVQHVLGPNKLWPGQIKVLNKTKSWTRDTWLTHSMWSDRDFILHGWQKRKLNANMFASWLSPLKSLSIDLTPCYSNRSVAYLNWKYKNNFIKGDEEIKAMLVKRNEVVNKEYYQTVKTHILKIMRT